MDPPWDLTHGKCWNHLFREAAARCPGCGRLFCRECVSEHRERVLCADCLRAAGAPADVRRRRFAAVRGSLRVVAGVLCAWLFFHVLGLLLLRFPDTFHAVRPSGDAADVAP